MNIKYYYCVFCCVRCVFLCGEDVFIGKLYEYCWGWVEECLFVFVKVFCIDVCVYVVMSNYIYVVFYVDDKKVNRLFDKVIFLCWYKFSKMMFLG